MLTSSQDLEGDARPHASHVVWILTAGTRVVRQSRDLEDLKLLVSFLGLKSAAEALAVLHSVYPEAEVTDRARLLLEDVVAEISGGWQPTTDPGVDAT